jgi:hypothetical protein
VWKLTSDHYESVLAKERGEADARMAVTLANYRDRVFKAREERNANQTIVDSLSTFIAGLQPTVIRIPAPHHSGKQNCTDSNGETWVALGRINGYTAISPGDRSRITRTYQRCAVLNLDAIEKNTACN